MIESTEARQATAEEVLDAMRAQDNTEVSFQFSGKGIRLTAKEWNDILDAARRGLRTLRAAT